MFSETWPLYKSLVVLALELTDTPASRGRRCHTQPLSLVTAEILFTQRCAVCKYACRYALQDTLAELLLVPLSQGLSLAWSQPGSQQAPGTLLSSHPTVPGLQP